MEIVTDVAIVVGLIRDIIFLLLLLAVLIALLIVVRKVRELLDTVNETADTVQEAVNTISENVVEPAASNAGKMRGLGGFIGFIMGMRDGKRRKNK